jgi:hypothetical protein
MGLSDRLAIVGVLIGLGGVGVSVGEPALFAHMDRTLAALLFWGGLVLIAAMLLILLGHWLPGIMRTLFATGCVPLPDAAAALYAASLGQPIAHLAERSHGDTTTPDDISTWYAYWITERGVTIYGRRPPSTIAQPISAEDLDALIFGDGASMLWRSGAPQPVYTDLEIRRTDLRALRETLSHPGPPSV